MPKPRMLTAILCCFVLALQIAVRAQSAADPDINKKIRQEEMDHSQIMHTMHFLTDVYGPRLTGSPNHEAAADWAMKEMMAWGFENAHLETWDFGHPGWMNERASGYIVSPIHDQLTFKVWAWTPSTKGTVKAEVFQMVPAGETNERKTHRVPRFGQGQSQKANRAGREGGVRPRRHRRSSPTPGR